MKFERQLKEEVSVNLTPLIDVVFLLLIFFMVTTTFTRDTNLLINLPEASGEVMDVAPDQIEVMVAQNGSYAVNGRGLVNSQLSTLMDAIEEMSAGDRSLPVIITADANTSSIKISIHLNPLQRNLHLKQTKHQMETGTVYT